MTNPAELNLNDVSPRPDRAPGRPVSIDRTGPSRTWTSYAERIPSIDNIRKPQRKPHTPPRPTALLFAEEVHQLPDIDPTNVSESDHRAHRIFDLISIFRGQYVTLPQEQDPIVTFRDGTAAIIPRTGAPALHGVVPARLKIRTLSEFEVERLMWQHRDPQGAIFRGQQPIWDATFDAIRDRTIPVITARLSAADRSLLRPGSLHIVGHARHLLQVEAVADGRTVDEYEADQVELIRLAQLSDVERQRGDFRPLTPRAARAETHRAEVQDRGLEGGVWMPVTFWLAWVRVQHWTYDGSWMEDRLVMLHPLVGYRGEPNLLLGALATSIRKVQAGQARAWPVGERHWFSGRGSPLELIGTDPY